MSPNHIVTYSSFANAKRLCAPLFLDRIFKGFEPMIVKAAEPPVRSVLYIDLKHRSFDEFSGLGRTIVAYLQRVGRLKACKGLIEVIAK